ncbi:MAG: hypothetical protein ACI8Y4_003796 [Candidatus Poriferisodalaceae bacterium]|jgi:hypothetical protein
MSETLARVRSVEVFPNPAVIEAPAERFNCGVATPFPTASGVGRC